MLYNKSKFKPVDGKKVLHKIKKHWVAISIAMLSLIGGGAVATTDASANTNVNSQNDNQANHSLNANRVQNSQAKLVTNNQNDHNNQITLQANDKNIKAETDQLHKNIINNAVVNSTMKSRIGQVKNDYQATQMQSHASNSNSVKPTSASANSNRSTATSANDASLATESAFVSNAVASVLSRGGHMVSVSPAVRSFMINGASKIASYNRITESNANATVNYLNSLSPSTSSLASEKSLAESYAQNFYTNKQNRNNMIMNGEAAHDIKVWGEDPEYFTLYQADPGRIINNVRSFYEPNASSIASLTGLVKDNVAQMISHSSSTATSSSSMSANTPRSASQNTKSLARVLNNDASTLSSYNQENDNYVNTILMDLDTLDVSNSPILSYAKNNVSKYSNRITSFMNKETNEANSLNNYSNYSNSSTNASTISTANKDISEASLVSHDASLVMKNYINPLKEQSEERSSANTNSPQFNFNSASISESLSNSVQNSVAVSQYNSSVEALSLSQASSIANRRVPINSSDVAPQSNSQAHSNLSKRTISNNIIPRESSSRQAASRGNNLVHFWNDSSSRNTSSDVSMPDKSKDTTQNKHFISGNQQATNPMTSNADDTGNLNNNGNGVNNQNQIVSADNDQLSNPNLSNPKRANEGINTVNGNEQNEETKTTHDSSPMINNSPINTVDVRSNQDNSANTDKLPQTGDSSFKDEEMAEIALIMSTTFGTLTAYIDKRRDD